MRPSTLSTISVPSAAGRGLAATIVGSGELDARGHAAWARLAERAVEPNPFFHPDFVLSAGGADLLVVRDGGEWIACLPLERARRWRRLPLPCLAPWRPDLAYLATPLVERERLDAAATALASFTAGARSVAALVLDPIAPHGPVGAALAHAFAAAGRPPIILREWERAALERRVDATRAEDTIAGKRARELRRLRRALAGELGGELTVVDRADDPSAYDDFLALERAGWKGQAGTALACTPSGAGFFRALCSGLASRGRLQLLSLECGDRIAAMQCNLRAGDVLFGFKIAYDPRLARFSPGVLLEAAGIDAFHFHTSARVLDSCAAPDHRLVSRLWPDRIALQAQLIPAGSPLAALVRPAVRVEARARRVAHSARRRSGAGNTRP